MYITLPFGFSPFLSKAIENHNGCDSRVTCDYQLYYYICKNFRKIFQSLAKYLIVRYVIYIIIHRLNDYGRMEHFFFRE